MEGKEQETPEQQGGKIQKKFEQRLAQLNSVLGGREPFKPKRLDGNVLGDLITEFFKEEDDKLRVQVKEKLSKLLDGHAELHAEVARQQQAVLKVKNQKMEEFVKAADALFSLIEQSKAKKEAYAKSLGAVTGEDKGDEPTVTE